MARFQEGLANHRRNSERELVALDLDSSARSLVNEYLDDRRAARLKGASTSLSIEEAHRLLVQSGFHRTLTAQQDRDLIRLLQLKHGANFSVPGAGKTTTLLALHCILKAVGAVSCLFVVAPINAFISWEDEVADIFGTDAWKVIRLQNENLARGLTVEHQSLDLFLVNYEKLRKDVKHLVPFFVRSSVHLVLDEAHRIKSGHSNLSFRQVIRLGGSGEATGYSYGYPYASEQQRSGPAVRLPMVHAPSFHISSH